MQSNEKMAIVYVAVSIDSLIDIELRKILENVCYKHCRVRKIATNTTVIGIEWKHRSAEENLADLGRMGEQVLIK